MLHDGVERREEGENFKNLIAAIMKKESPDFRRHYEEKCDKKLKQGLIYKNERNNDFYTETSAY